MQIISNNPKVRENIKDCPVVFIDGEYGDVLNHVKRLIIEEKLVLLSHPLSGSIKPNETYYRSILITTTTNKEIDMESLDLIDQAIAVYDKFIMNQKTPQWIDRVLEDFALIDLDIMQSTLQRIRFSPEIRLS